MRNSRTGILGLPEFLGYSLSSYLSFLTLTDTMAGMFAIRARRKVATEKDFLSAVEKVIKGNLKFNSTATYMQYN